MDPEAGDIVAALLELHEYSFGVDTNCSCGHPGIYFWDDYRQHIALTIQAM